tara:strand:+ start:285 stop:1019 length:735 start_codon:yes stop_codon:yes gene_type:complete
MIKGYVIQISSNKLSKESAEKTIESARNIGKIDVEPFEGIHKDDSIKLNNFNLIDEKHLWEKIGVKESILGCFLSHFNLWKKSVDMDEKIMILEHDVIFTNKFQDYDFEGVINYGAPLWETSPKENRFDFESIHEKRNRRGFHKRSCGCVVEEMKECYCHDYYLHGAHCYTITPKAASQLIKKSSQIGIVPADLHVNRFNIEIGDVYPFCSYQNQTFSLIQKRLEIQSWYEDELFKCEEEAWMS